MGRPIKQKYFDPAPDTVGAEVRIGGEGVASTGGNVAVTFANVGLGYYAANAAVTFSAPQLPGGTTATGSVYLFANGAVKAVGLSSAGTGYTTKPTLTFTGANTYVASGTITGGGLTATVTNVLAVSAYIPVANGGSSAVVGDIVAQKSSRRYKVTTAQGTGVCKLVAAAPAAGQLTLIATDSQGSTYYVTKLTARKALVTQKTMGTGYDYTTGTEAKWSIDGTTSAPTATDIGTVTLASN